MVFRHSRFVLLLFLLGYSVLAAPLTVESSTENQSVQSSTKDVSFSPVSLTEVYADTFPQTPYTSIWISSSYSNHLINTMTPDAFSTIGNLIAVTDWDFSGNFSSSRNFTTQVPINAAETCSYNACGFRNPGNEYFLRIDNGATSGMAMDFNGTDTYFARAFIIDENSADEVFLCIDGTTDHGDWALLHFPHNMGGRYFLQVGDSWTRDLNCLQDLFMGTTCGAGGTGAYADGYTHGDVVQSGIVHLPSGHHMDAMLVRQELYAENFLFKVFDVCTFPVPGYEEIRIYQYSWFVPYMGFVVQIMSNFDVSDATSWTTARQSSFAFGLFPPVSISLVGVTSDSVTISWNPGNITTYIDNYKIYWDGTESGAISDYDYNSDTHSSQVSFAGTEATISGLTPGTTYYITVTNRYTYTDPKSSIDTTYESIKYPVRVTGGTTYEYPTEVTATTDLILTPTFTGTWASPTPTDTMAPTVTPSSTSTASFSPTLHPSPTPSVAPSLTPTETPTITPVTTPAIPALSCWLFPLLLTGLVLLLHPLFFLRQR